MVAKKGTLLPKKGTLLPDEPANGQAVVCYCAMIASALRQDPGHSRGAIKTVMQWTGASERTVKNWFAGTKGPRGEHLIALARHSEPVLVGLLSLCGHEHPIDPDRLARVRNGLADAVSFLDRLRPRFPG